MRLSDGSSDVCSSDLTPAALGFVNLGGTLDVPGLLFANRSTWAHVVDAAAGVLGQSRGGLLSEAELAAVDGRGDPATILRPASGSTLSTVQPGERVHATHGAARSPAYPVWTQGRRRLATPHTHRPPPPSA